MQRETVRSKNNATRETASLPSSRPWTGCRRETATSRTQSYKHVTTIRASDSCLMLDYVRIINFRIIVIIIVIISFPTGNKMEKIQHPCNHLLTGEV